MGKGRKQAISSHNGKLVTTQSLFFGSECNFRSLISEVDHSEGPIEQSPYLSLSKF